MISSPVSNWKRHNILISLTLNGKVLMPRHFFFTFTSPVYIGKNLLVDPMLTLLLVRQVTVAIFSSEIFNTTVIYFDYVRF